MNRERGEVAFQADGATHTLRFTANALCELEEKLDLSTPEIVGLVSDPKRLRMSHCRAMVWAALRHGDATMTLERAGEIMTTVGMKDMMGLIGQAIVAAFPPDKEETSARPPKEAKRGTGGASSLRSPNSGSIQNSSGA